MVTVILKPTEACNAACVYCEVDRKGWLVTKLMSPDTLEQVFVRINEFLLEREEERIKIIWHGGEPLLVGEDFLEKALEFQREHCRHTLDRINHTIQSNLTLFSDRFVRVFRELGVSSVGTSYDPVAGVRLLKTKDSLEYNRLFLNGTEALERAGFDWGVICVVTRLSLDRPLDLFYFLTNLAPKGGVMFNPVMVDKPNQKYLEIDDGEFTEFLGAIFPIWWKHRKRYPRVEPFRSLTETILSGGRRTFFCADSGNCANTHIGISPDGKLSHCGRAADWGTLDYGSIFERTFSDVFADPQRAALRDRTRVLREGACKECKYWALCYGGCPLDGWANTGSFMGKTAWCQNRGGFVARYFEPVTGISPKLNPTFDVRPIQV